MLIPLKIHIMLTRNTGISEWHQEAIVIAVGNTRPPFSNTGISEWHAKVHAGVQADEVMKHAEFVADVINRQLIPAIVHLNFGKVEGMPLPELRFKLPQAAANIERAQFWSQVLAIPGMSVVKSEVYDSLGIAMPSDDDEVLETPSQQDGGLAGMLQGFGQREPKDKDEVALAARSRSKQDLLPAAMQAWLAPIKKKLIEARKAGASFEELREQMLKWRPDTDALAGAFSENMEAGLRGDAEEEVEAAKNKPKHVKGCNQHEDQPGCTAGNKEQEENEPGKQDVVQYPAQWEPIMMPKNMDAELALAELNKGIKITNPLGEEITLDNRIVQHWKNHTKNKKDINERLSLLPLIKEVVKNPAEIWEQENGKRTYLASVISSFERGKRYTVAFTRVDDNLVLETYFPNSNSIGSKRAGKLLWSKKTAVVSGT